MKLVASGGQQVRHCLYRADGSIAVGGTPQLVLARSQARSYLLVQNISAGPLTVEIGSGQATATITNGAVTSVAVNNPGFNYTKPPVVEFMGGGYAGNSSYLGLNQPLGEAPNSLNGIVGRPAKGRAILTGGAISSIVVDDGGAGYAIAPYVLIYNSDLDPYGVALPTNTSGIIVPAGGKLEYNGTVCPVCPVSIYGANTGQAYAVRWMD